MAIQGECIQTGASPICEVCGKKYVMQVLHSAAGYYIGTECCDGPNSRESGYYKNYFNVEVVLLSGQYSR